MGACYVYGVTFSGTPIPEDVRGIDDRPIDLIPHGRCAALVSELTAEAGERALGTRDDLLAHGRVLETVARREVPVLPFRFGAVLPGRDEVSRDLLAAHEEDFLTDLDRIAGRVEMVVKGRYESEIPYREVLAEVPELLDLRERIRGLPEDATYYERIRLGELVAQALADKRVADEDRLVKTMAPYADAVVARRPAHEDEVADVSILVDRERRGDLERALEDLGADWAGRIRLRLLGPLPPYDFVGPRQQQEV